jgi:hypothetical protein
MRTNWCQWLHSLALRSLCLVQLTLDFMVRDVHTSLQLNIYHFYIPRKKQLAHLFLPSKYYLFLCNVATCSSPKWSSSGCVNGGEYSEFLFWWNTWSPPYKLHLLQLCCCTKTHLTTALVMYNVKILFHACVVVLLWSKVFHYIQWHKILFNCKMIIQTVKFCPCCTKNWKVFLFLFIVHCIWLYNFDSAYV